MIVRDGGNIKSPTYKNNSLLEKIHKWFIYLRPVFWIRNKIFQYKCYKCGFPSGSLIHPKDMSIKVNVKLDQIKPIEGRRFNIVDRAIQQSEKYKDLPEITESDIICLDSNGG
jgi:hypothetical protein